LRPVAYPLLAALSLTLIAAAPPQKPVSYRVTPVGGGQPALEVRMRFRGEADGETAIFLPSEWAGSTELWRHATRLTVRGADSVTGTFAEPVIHHRPGARIEVRYTLVSAYTEDPGFAYEKARPMLRADWFFVHGESLFAHAGSDPAGPARFKWGKLPRGWSVASDLDHLKGKTSTIANLTNSVAIGGEHLRVVRRVLDGGAPLRVAVIGTWAFEPDELAATVAPIIEAEEAYWGEKNGPFLVALAPQGKVPAGLSYTGTGRADAFSIASTSEFPLKQATRFLGHEFMHSWVPIALGNMPEENEAVDYWFSEGFTDYLASKVLLRAGIWSLEQWAADKNETLLRYGTSPAKRATGAEIAERFWTDQNVQQVSYDRGHLLAARLDAEIAVRSGGKMSLDDVMRAQKQAAVGSSELATALFRRLLREKTGIDIDADLELYARRGEPLLLPADIYGDCARLVSERRREFHRGYDADATRKAGGVITGVVPDGPAYAAGMRDGMQLVRRESGVIGDSTVELSYRVTSDGAERVLRYKPEGKTEFEVQRIAVTAATPEQQGACRTRLGGRR
jgi:predicted metalloprotease with PDZ domain